jgi:hypothetical protein
MLTGYFKSKSGSERSKTWFYPARICFTQAITLDFGAQLERFLQQSPFARSRVITNNFLTTVSAIKGILQRELGIEKFSRRWVSHC